MVKNDLLANYFLKRLVTFNKLKGVLYSLMYDLDGIKRYLINIRFIAFI